VIAAFREAAWLRGALFYFDITEINLPYRDHLAQALKAGRLPPRWHPGLYCGHPLFSESQAGYLHPLKFLYAILPTWQALNLDTVGSVWLTGVFAYMWLRRHVGACGALAGALVTALGGYTWSHLVHTSMINALASVPLIFWLLELSWSRGRLWPAALGGLALAAQVFAGHLQDTILTVMLVGVVSAGRYMAMPRSAARSFILASSACLVALGGLISAIQWIPSKALLDQSPRARGLEWEDLTFGSFSPELIPTVLVRELYGTRARDTDWLDGFYPWQEMDVYLGVGTLILVIVGLKQRRRRWLAPWVLAGVLGVALMLGRYTVLMDFWPGVPILGSARIPVRFHLWVTMAAAAVAAAGMDAVARGDREVRLKPAVACLCILAFASIAILAAQYHPVWTQSRRWSRLEDQLHFTWLGSEIAWAVGRNALILGMSFGCLRAALKSPSAAGRALAAGAIPILILFDLVTAHFHDCPTVDPVYWTETPAVARAIAEDPGSVRMLGQRDYSSGEPGYASKPVDFLAVRDTLAWSLPPVFGLKTIKGETPIISIRRAWLDEIRTPERLALEGLTHLITARGMPETERIRPLGRFGSVYLHQVKDAIPRLRYMGEPIHVLDERAAARAVRDRGAELMRRVVIEDPKPIMSEDAQARGSARWVRDEAEWQEVQLDAETPGYLVMGDTYDPGWKAWLDGKPIRIVPANLAFRGVPITSPGRHQVVLRYEPAGWWPGVGLTVAGLVAWLIGMLVPVAVRHEISDDLEIDWPRRWLEFLIAGLVVIGAASALVPAPGSKIIPDSSNRWRTAYHPFTWGSGIEAIQPPRPLPIDE
jgi:hypothetical protein